MNEENAFLAAIIAQPDEDTPRLVFADWLEEHGDPDRAEFIRLQVRVMRLEYDAERETVLKEISRLFRQHGEEWLADLPKDIREYIPYYQLERGFLAKLNLTAAKLGRISKRAWTRHPIRELVLQDVGGRFDRVLALPQLNRIQKLSLHASSVGEGLQPSDLDALAGCPNLTGLRRLTLHTLAGNAVAEALAHCPSLRRLEALFLDDDRLDEQGIATLTQRGAGNLRTLKELSLEGCGIKAEAAVALANCAALANLETLFFRRSGTNNPGRIGDDGVAALAGSSNMAELRFLWLEYQGVGPRGARALAETQHMTKLRTLYLDGNHSLGADGVRAIVHGPWPEMTELRMDYCDLRDDAAEALAESGNLTALTELDLKYNWIGDRGAEALSNANWLNRLARLNLHENLIGDRGALALCESKSLAKLGMLRIKQRDDEEYSPAVTEALEKRFGKDVDSYFFE